MKAPQGHRYLTFAIVLVLSTVSSVEAGIFFARTVTYTTTYTTFTAVASNTNGGQVTTIPASTGSYLDSTWTVPAMTLTIPTSSDCGSTWTVPAFTQTVNGTRFTYPATTGSEPCWDSPTSSTVTSQMASSTVGNALYSTVTDLVSTCRPATTLTVVGPTITVSDRSSPSATPAISTKTITISSLSKTSIFITQTVSITSTKMVTVNNMFTTSITVTQFASVTPTKTVSVSVCTSISPKTATTSTTTSTTTTATIGVVYYTYIPINPPPATTSTRATTTSVKH